jgi:hypothetical protein
VVTGDQFFPSSSTTLGREQAVALINQWLRAKQTIFAPPYSQQQIETFTTGTLHRDLTGANGPVSWLSDRNAYYRFGTQRIEAVNNFSARSNQATIEVTVTEESTFWISGQGSPQESNSDTFDVRYFLEKVNGRWKISDYRILE